MILTPSPFRAKRWSSSAPCPARRPTSRSFSRFAAPRLARRSPSCPPRSPAARPWLPRRRPRPRRRTERARQLHPFSDAEGLSPPLEINSKLLRRFGCTGQLLEARPQHLAALAERRLGQALDDVRIHACRLLDRNDVDDGRGDLRRRDES